MKKIAKPVLVLDRVIGLVIGNGLKTSADETLRQHPHFQPQI